MSRLPGRVCATLLCSLLACDPAAPGVVAPLASPQGADEVFPPKTLAPAGPKSCIKLRARGDTLGQEGWVEVSPEQEIAVTLPVELEIQVGGRGRTEACDDWLRENLKSGEEEPLRALWVGVWVSKRLDRGRGFLYGLNTVSYKDRFTLGRLQSEEGGRLKLSPENLSGERKAFLYIKAAPETYDAQEDFLDDYIWEASMVRLHVLDTRLVKSLGARNSVVFLLRDKKINPGGALSVLYYPLRQSPKVTSRLLRDLSLDLKLVDAGEGEQLFSLLGAGIAWKEFIGLGYALDRTERGNGGFYVDLTILSTSGIFGLIPYKDFARALREALIRSEKGP